MNTLQKVMENSYQFLSILKIPMKFYMDLLTFISVAENSFKLHRNHPYISQENCKNKILFGKQLNHKNNLKHHT